MDIKYVTISDLNRYIKAKFDTDIHLNRVFIKGEISNFKHHTRGHLYFTLKDDTSRINAVMFASNVSNLNFEPSDGMKVLVTGRISVYEATGGYQIYVDAMEQDGIGNLYLEYEKLKKKLLAEGLFDSKHKVQLPKYPQKIGIITAPTGAAIRDILSTIKRRYPICETILFPALVQGIGAKESIVKAITTAQSYNIDLLIVGRGGGSIEDLWGFNEECVARAIYNSKIPIISAVGHEIDFTIADYVADLRAPTPTGAAEMAVPNMSDIFNLINQYIIRLNEAINNIIVNDQSILNNILNSYVLKNPLSLYEIKEQQLDNAIDKLNKTINNIIEKDILKYNNIINNNVLKNPNILFDHQNHNYQILLNKVELLNPLKILDKGYSVVKKDNKLVKDYNDVKINDIVEITLSKGLLKASIIGKENKK
jgi:exodeoxyribonuclease VII large subunit